MPLNHFVTLGRSGLKVSPFALGAMTFGPDLGPMSASVKDSEAMLAHYLERGGNFIDTANIYTRGHSEKILGDFFHRTGGRDRAVIATKFYGNLYPGDPNAGGSGRKAIYGALEQSLRRLKTDYVDLYWMHVYDQFTPLDETLRAIDDLVRAGKVRYFGLSDTPAHVLGVAQTLSQARGFTPVVALQIEYSLLERTPDYELLPAAKALGLGVTPWSPLKSGALSGRYSRATAASAEGGRAQMVKAGLGEPAFAVIDVLERIAKELDSTVARVALAWVQDRPGVTSTLIGARTLAQLQDNLQALDVKLSDTHRQQLDAVSAPPPYLLDKHLTAPFSFGYGGSTVDGIENPVLWLQPKSDAERH